MNHPPPRPPQALHVLMVEDNDADAELCARELRKFGYDPHIEAVQTAQDFCARLADRSFDIILAEHSLPQWNGMEALELLRLKEKDLPFILVTGALRDEQAAEFLHQGVADFVQKDRLTRVGLAVRLALERKMLRDDFAHLDRKHRESERRFHRLAELSPDALFIMSGENLAFINSAGAAQLGVTQPQSLLGQPIVSVIHPDARVAFIGHAEKFKDLFEPAAFDTWLLRADGSAGEVRVAATPIVYQDKPAVQLVARDASERKRVADAIQSLAAFPQLNPNPVLEFSSEGALTYCNAAAEELAKSVGRDDPAAVLPKDVESIVRLCLASGQKRLSVESSLGGRTFSWSFFPIKQNRVVHCYVTDITERQNLEAQLRHAQKLESVGRLAAGVAHDFNNVLTVIQGYTGLLRAEAAMSATGNESLQQIGRAAERAAKLTSQLLTFSRRTVMAPRRLDLNEVLNGISSLLHRTLGEDITFRFDYAPALPPIHADPGMIDQVIMNVAVNARDAMPKGGQIVLSTATVTVDESYVERHPAEARPGKFVCLTISDSGGGMDNVTLSRMFEPFFTTKEFGKGTGLGLATVYGIVKLHKGWIEVQSQLGQGSTFKVFLPPTEQIDRPAGAPPEDKVPQGSETILVVEDEAPVRGIIKGVLEHYGYRIVEAANGVEALAVWHHHHQDIALLLTDMVMPVGVSGQELAEKFSAQKPGLKVMYISGYSVQVAGKGFAVMEGVNFLQKPFDGIRLAYAVRHCLDH